MFRFGVFELSPQTGELRKSGVRIRLAPQPFELLIILVENCGNVVTREELRQRLWGKDETTVEFDAGVNRCIRQIRAALNDGADAPRYIETIPRKGYRFIAPVEPVTVNPAEPEPLKLEPESPISPAPQPARNRLRGWHTVAAGALIAGALAAWYWLPTRAQPNVRSGTPAPLAVDLGYHYAPTFSPDGKQIAFVWDGPQRNSFDIYLKSATSTAPPVRLTASGDVDYSPAWSPDGQWIAFCRGTSVTGGAIWLLPSTGGTERKLVDLSSIAVPENRSIAWTPDSKSLYVTAKVRSEPNQGLILLNVETREAKVVLSDGGATEVFMHPAVSPDGSTVAFTRDTGRGVSAIVLFRPGVDDAPAELPAISTRAEFRGVASSHPAWTPDGKSLVFTSNALGRLRLWMASTQPGSQLEELSSLGEGLTSPAISRSGDLAFGKAEYDTSIWRLDIKHSTAATPAQVVASTRPENNPAVSPDGQRLAFASSQSGYNEIWTSRLDGSQAVPLTSLRNPVTGSPAWSPDGRRIAFDSRFEGQAHIYVIDSAGGKPSRLTSGASSVVPQWSPDGKSIYYSSDASGRMEVWRVQAEGGTPEQITSQGGFGLILSSDGTLLYHSRDNALGSPLFELELASGKARQIVAEVPNRGFTFANGHLYYIQGSAYQGENRLFLFKPRAANGTFLARFTHQIDRSISVTPDGQYLYYAGVDRSGHELLIVNGFAR